MFLHIKWKTTFGHNITYIEIQSILCNQFFIRHHILQCTCKLYDRNTVCVCILITREPLICSFAWLCFWSSSYLTKVNITCKDTCHLDSVNMITQATTLRFSHHDEAESICSRELCCAESRTPLSLVKYKVPDSRKVAIFLACLSDSLVKHSYTL